MSEEEQELIKNCKRWIDEEDIDYTRWFGLNELAILINLITKKQKEIEELKKDISNMYEESNMKYLKIKDNVDLNVLLNYGFEKNPRYDIYAYTLDEDGDNLSCDILVNTTEHNDRILRFYYYDDLDNKITYQSLEDDDGNYIGEGVDEIIPIDYDIPIPEVIFKLIQDNIVEIY